MIDIDASLPDFGAFGWPLHGLFKDREISLPNGSKARSSQAPPGGDNWLLAVPGAPGASRTPEQAAADEAAGLTWPADVLCWDGHVHGDSIRQISGYEGEGNPSFVYAEGPGLCWVVAVGGFYDGEVGVYVRPLQGGHEIEPLSFRVPVLGDSAEESGYVPSDNLRAVDATPTGSRAIMVGSRPYGLFDVTVERVHGEWSFSVTHLSAGDNKYEIVSYNMEDKYRGFAFLIKESGESNLDGGLFWDELSQSVRVEETWGPQGYPLKTKRLSFSVEAQSFISDKSEYELPLIAQWLIREGTSRLETPPFIVGAWLDEGGELHLLTWNVSAELKVEGAVTGQASGMLYQENAYVFYEDPETGDERPLSVTAGLVWPDRQNSTAAYSVAFSATFMETVTTRLMLDGAEVDRAVLEREWRVEQVSEQLYWTENTPIQYSGENPDLINHGAPKCLLTVTVKIDGELVDSVSHTRLMKTGVSAGSSHTLPKNDALDIDLPGIMSIPDGTYIPGGWLPQIRINRYRGAADYYCKAFSYKLCALATSFSDGSVQGFEMHDAICPTGKVIGSAMSVPPDLYHFRLKGSYNSRTKEVAIDYADHINWV